MVQRVTRLSLFGTFHIEGPGGENLTPKGRKAQALLALLVLAERGVCSRVWLCDKLWSEKQAEQAFASLRQCLRDIRKSLGKHCAEILDIGQISVRLDLSAVEVDALKVREAWMRGDFNHPVLASQGEFLAGIDVGDPEFEEWLALERARWFNLREESEALAKQRASAAKASSAVVMPVHEAGSRHDLLRPAILILPPVLQTQSPRGRHLADALTELFIRNVVEIQSIDVVDGRENHAPTFDGSIQRNDKSSVLVFQTKVRDTGAEFVAELKIANSHTSRIEWVANLPVTYDVSGIERNQQVLSYINFATDAAQSIYRRLLASSNDRPEAMAQLLILAAIDDMYDLGRERHAQAEARIQKSLELAPDAQSYAWMAYLQTFKVGQCLAPRSPLITEKAEWASRKAIELDPNNALSLALCSHVNLFILNNRDRARDLVQRSLAINPNRPLSWDIYSVMHAYNGQPQEGIRHANWASSIAELNPYIFFLDTAKCMNYTLAGDFASAVASGFKALSARPDFLPALRYTLISLGNMGRIEEAGRLAAEIRRVDPLGDSTDAIKSAHLNLPEEQIAILEKGLKRSSMAVPYSVVSTNAKNAKSMLRTNRRLSTTKLVVVKPKAS